MASHCAQPPRATILFHFSASKSLFLRHVDVHIRFDTTPFRPFPTAHPVMCEIL
jgi:hypothetical protein